MDSTRQNFSEESMTTYLNATASSWELQPYDLEDRSSTGEPTLTVYSQEEVGYNYVGYHHHRSGYAHAYEPLVSRLEDETFFLGFTRQEDVWGTSTMDATVQHGSIILPSRVNSPMSRDDAAQHQMTITDSHYRRGLRTGGMSVMRVSALHAPESRDFRAQSPFFGLSALLHRAQDNIGFTSVYTDPHDNIYRDISSGAPSPSQSPGPPDFFSQSSRVLSWSSEGGRTRRYHSTTPPISSDLRQETATNQSQTDADMQLDASNDLNQSDTVVDPDNDIPHVDHMMESTTSQPAKQVLLIEDKPSSQPAKQVLMIENKPTSQPAEEVLMIEDKPIKHRRRKHRTLAPAADSTMEHARDVVVLTKVKVESTSQFVRNGRMHRPH